MNLHNSKNYLVDIGMTEDDCEHIVVIIGAGTAGLKLASELYANGVKKCIVLEARERTGGRILTVNSDVFPDRVYDLGASWHHDTLDNGLFKEECSLPPSERAEYAFDDDYLTVVDMQGRKLDYNRDLHLEILQQELDQYIENKYYESIETKDMSYYEIVMLYLHERRNQLTDDQIRYFTQFVRNVEFWHGGDWKLLSGKHSKMCFNGRNAFVSNYNKIFSRLEQSVPREWVKLNTEVSKIERRPGSVVVTTSTGARYVSKYCVVTVPQSVLELSLSKERVPGRIEFAPQLNKNIRDALKVSHFGSLGKIIFEFEEATWSNELWTLMVVPETMNDFVNVVRSEPDFQALLSRLNAEEGVSLIEHPSLFLNLASKTGTPSLMCFTQQPLTEYIEGLHPAKIVELMKPVLNRALAALGSSSECIVDLENQISSSSAGGTPILKNVIVSNWTKDSYSLGSYSFSRTNDDPLTAVLAFIDGQDMRIKFAGEHTVMDGNGCVYGAWESGKREANYILKQLKNKPCPNH
ncbi:HCL491Cp [Eremothecium sinecaudum]|uniref:HCL491Cp n=1 Tax=Eremothecium sinecaudum TaxID=45286 RepID=A0A109UW54_9SACH|nr:HCL491Cp [Eremothecium sinecaudum]AMD19660.1 HCL491Cp [Eremothecium sinecaudum]